MGKDKKKKETSFDGNSANPKEPRNSSSNGITKSPRRTTGASRHEKSHAEKLFKNSTSSAGYSKSSVSGSISASREGDGCVGCKKIIEELYNQGCWMFRGTTVRKSGESVRTHHATRSKTERDEKSFSSEGG